METESFGEKRQDEQWRPQEVEGRPCFRKFVQAELEEGGMRVENFSFKIEAM